MTTAKCPKCNASFSSEPDAHGFIACPACGTRLHAQVPTPTGQSDIRVLAGELRDIRRLQGEILQYQAQILAMLKSWPPQPSPAAAPATPAAPSVAATDGGAAPAPEPEPPRPLPRVRQRRKTVLLIDDDDTTRRAAVAALETAQVPVRLANDGNAALQSLAADKADVIVLEIGIGEPMAGKDFVNYVKATMEWVDVPIVLYTRVPVEGQREARTVHGADEVVLKGPGSPEALLNRVIQVFQRA